MIVIRDIACRYRLIESRGIQLFSRFRIIAGNRRNRFVDRPVFRRVYRIEAAQDFFCPIRIPVSHTGLRIVQISASDQSIPARTGRRYGLGEILFVQAQRNSLPECLQPDRLQILLEGVESRRKLPLLQRVGIAVEDQTENRFSRGCIYGFALSVFIQILCLQFIFRQFSLKEHFLLLRFVGNTEDFCGIGLIHSLRRSVCRIRIGM